MAGGALDVRGSLGQPVANRAENAHYEATVGFWFVIQQDVAVGIESSDPPPLATRLDRNRPNPFNATTTISFVLARAGHVSLKIYDIAGREVLTLVNGELPAGEHGVTLKTDRLASGIYFYRMEAKDFVRSGRMVLLR